MARIRHRDFGKGLYLAGGREGIPRGTLLQAKGVRPFNTPQIRSRFGSQAVINQAAVQSLYSFNGNRYFGTNTGLFGFTPFGGFAPSTMRSNLGGHRLRFAKGIPSVDGNRRAFFSGPEHLFVVGGGIIPAGNEKSSGTLGQSLIFKVDSNNGITNMGISSPQQQSGQVIGPLAVASNRAKNQANANQDQILDTFDTFVAWNAVLVDPFTVPVINSSAIAQEGFAMRVAVPEDSVSSLGRSFNPIRNLLNVADGVGNGRLVKSSEQDWIQMWVFCDQPANLDFMELLLTSPASAGAGFRDTFSYQILVEDSVFASSGITGIGDNPAFFAAQQQQTPDQLRQQQNAQKKAQDKLDKKLIPVQAEKVLNNDLGSTRLAKTSLAWTLIRIPKESFSKSGEPDWARINGAEITIKTNSSGPVQLFFDQLGLHLGTGLMGNYRYAYTYKNSKTGTRSNPFIGNLLVGGDADVADVQRDAVVILNLQLPVDPQVDKIELWRTVGNGSVYFKIDEVDKALFPALGQAGYTDVIADFPGIQKSQEQAFDLRDLVAGQTRYVQAEELPLDNATFPVGLIDIAGPHFNRMFAIDGMTFHVNPQLGYEGGRGRLYYSPVGRLEVNEGFIEVTTDDDPLQRVLVWSNNLYVFSKEHLFEVQGSDVFIAVEISGVLGTVRPDTVVPTPFGICYQAADGIRVFDGAGSQLIAPEAILPLSRGETNLNPFIAARQFTGITASYKDEEYLISDAVDTLAVNLRTGVWRNVGVLANCLYTEPPNLIQGAAYPAHLLLANLTKVLDWEIPGATTDDGSSITFLAETPGTLIEDQSGVTKLVQRLYLDFEGGPITVSLRYLAAGSLLAVATNLTNSFRQLTEIALLQPSDIIGVQISGNLVDELVVYGVELDWHQPEEGGSLT